MTSLFIKNDDFLFTTHEDIRNASGDWVNENEITKIFGYCITNKEHIRNAIIENEVFDYIQEHNVDICGIFSAIRFKEGKLSIVLDPLCQFNIFYYYENKHYTISSSLELIRIFHKIREENTTYLFDQLAYQSPMRSQTILKNVHFLQFEDLVSSQTKKFSTSFTSSILNSKFLHINIPEYKKYDAYSYEDLLDLYNERLNSRTSILSSKFDEIHIQLTGGADSRLVLSSFLKYENLYCYVYGDGSNQNRLIFEEITTALNVKKVNDIKLVGQPLCNSSRIFRGLHDTNYFKLNNLNTYMNGSLLSEKSICKITGYYGANVSGSVVLPPEKTETNRRLEKIPPSCFTYHEYVDDFKYKYTGMRRAEFNDRFYINNRGKSHYAAHSLADNRFIASVDVLYDFINIILVRKCPYSDKDIDSNAITIDLICKNHHQLALFPYDSRKIPSYRNFDQVPLINCFNGYTFPNRELPNFTITRPLLNDSEFNFLKVDESQISVKAMLGYKEIRNLALNYPELEFMLEQDDAQAGIFLYFLLGKLMITA